MKYLKYIHSKNLGPEFEPSSPLDPSRKKMAYCFQFKKSGFLSCVLHMNTPAQGRWAFPPPSSLYYDELWTYISLPYPCHSPSGFLKWNYLSCRVLKLALIFLFCAASVLCLEMDNLNIKQVSWNSTQLMPYKSAHLTVMNRDRCFSWWLYKRCLWKRRKKKRLKKPEWRINCADKSWYIYL